MKKVWTLLAVVAVAAALGFSAQSAMAFTVSGTVIDANAAAVEGAQVVIMGGGMGRHQRPMMARTQTDANGAWSFADVGNGRYMVAAVARDVGMGGQRVEVADADVADVTITLQGMGGGHGGGHGGGGGGQDSVAVGSVNGTITDSAGAAVEGARVALMPGRMAQRGHRARPVIATTDANGAYSFANVPAGHWFIMAAKRDVGAARDALDVVADQATQKDLVLQMPHFGGGHH